jgi:hypothetical protein
MTESTKSNIRSLIFNKLENLQRGPKTIKKFFPFTMEDLADDYEGCIEAIENFIESHKDKILDFEFESWVDEVTMTPVLMMKMYLVPSIALHLTNISFLNNLLPSSVESEIIREEITNIIAEYQGKFNDAQTRSHLANKLKFKLMADDILDKTSDEDIDNQKFTFVVVKNGKELELNEYLNQIAAQKRFE